MANASRLGGFRNKILTMDSHAEFHDNDLRKIRCSSCTSWVTMRLLYDIRRFSEHRNSPRCQVAQQEGLVNKSIRHFFSIQAVTQKIPSLSTLPCPGLSRKNPKIARYLRRSMGTGGGAPSRTSITKVLFGNDVAYTFLSDVHKKMVIRREETLFQWRNNRNIGAVFSTKCNQDVLTAPSKAPLPCSACRDLLRLHTFQVVLLRPTPPDSMMKFTPANRRDPELGDIYLKVKGVHDLVESVSLTCFRT